MGAVMIVLLLGIGLGLIWVGWTGAWTRHSLPPLDGLPGGTVVVDTSGAPQIPAPPQDITDGDGNFSLEVVGEYYNKQAGIYQRRNDEVRFAMVALVPEANNPFDPNAVAVMAQQAVVGHLARPDAVAYRKLYGTSVTQCRAIIQGGNVKDSVWLDSRVGSGMITASAAFHSDSVAYSFPLHAQGEQLHLEELSSLMAGRSGRIVDAHIQMVGPHAMVVVEGKHIGYLKQAISRWFASTHGEQAVSTLAFIKATSNGYMARVRAHGTLEGTQWM